MSWEKYTLKELCTDIIDCVNKTAPVSGTPTQYKMLRTTNVRNGKITLTDLNCVTEETFEKWTRRGKLKVGDVILTREAPLGEVGIVREADNFFLGQRLVLLRANPEVCNNRFLLYALMFHDNKQAIIAKGSGSTVLHLRVPECKRIEIPAPDLSTQTKIADILSAYDDLVDNNQKQIKLLEEAAQRLYKEWFVDLRFPGYEDVEIVDGVPEGWKKSAFSENVSIMSGGTPKTSNPNYYGGTIPFYTPKDADGAFFADQTLTYITEEGLNNCNSKYYPKGTVIITARGTVGKTTILSAPMAMNQSCYALKFKDFDAPYFLFFSLNDEVRKLKAMANGGVFNTIIVKTFDSICIWDLPKDIISSFEDTVSPYMEQIQNCMQSNKLLEEARDRLLPKLMSGELEI